ncbi:hypothetical protein BsWGS_05060 [Bradybaena similaris]
MYQSVAFRDMDARGQTSRLDARTCSLSIHIFLDWMLISIYRDPLDCQGQRLLCVPPCHSACCWYQLDTPSTCRHSTFSVQTFHLQHADIPPSACRHSTFSMQTFHLQHVDIPPSTCRHSMRNGMSELHEHITYSLSCTLHKFVPDAQYLLQ